jgi:putative protein kinase ArgK-like GTPase of G3E family
MRMFRDMANANYDVHMMETVGKGEKCVDIQLAVEMLHYATVPNAFDMAVILTGDKVSITSSSDIDVSNSRYLNKSICCPGLCARISKNASKRQRGCYMFHEIWV